MSNSEKLRPEDNLIEEISRRTKLEQRIRMYEEMMHHAEKSHVRPSEEQLEPIRKTLEQLRAELAELIKPS